jgi:NAD(P)-dependent dehydrogenase (short-subunit alcohol dehydrogenase family)
VSKRLEGRSAIVTGGASGLGECISHRLAGEGAMVAVADVDEPSAQLVAAAIVQAGDDAEPMTVDITPQEGEVAAMVDSVAERTGSVDLLVCSAAIEVRASLADTTDEDWQRIIDVNLKGPFLCLKHTIPAMVRAGGGSAILMGSVLGAIGSPGYAAYCASKAALVNLAKQAAIEHAPDQVRVNVVSPSASETGLFIRVAESTSDPEGIKAMVAERTPMGRLATAMDVTNAVLYLASDESAYVTGTVLPLDGGMAARRM